MCFISLLWNLKMVTHQLYQHVEVFPKVLCHESEESQEGPAEAVKAGVSVVWIPPSFHACVTLRAAAKGWRERENGAPSPKMTQHYLLIIKSDFKHIGELQQVLVGSAALRGGQKNQLTQSLSCSHREEHPAGQAGSRNWLKKKQTYSHNESFRSHSVAATVVYSAKVCKSIQTNFWLQFAHAFSIQCSSFQTNSFCLSSAKMTYCFLVPAYGLTHTSRSLPAQRLAKLSLYLLSFMMYSSQSKPLLPLAR